MRWPIRAWWHVGARIQERLQVDQGDPPLLADLEAAKMPSAQPLGHGSLVDLQARGDLRRC